MVEVSQMQDACKVLELFIKYSNDILNLNNKYNFQLNNQLDTGVGVTPLLGDALSGAVGLCFREILKYIL